MSEQRWAALCERAAPPDDPFVYGVLTTGVFCRPTCPSRRPNRENVRFFDDPRSARDAGFRACKRCRPEHDEGAREAAVVETACRMLGSGAPLGEIAAAVGISESHLHRVFRAATGSTPGQWARADRARRAREALQSEPSVTDAIFAAGFESTGRFYEGADGFLGMTPSRFRAGGEGADIQWVVGACSLGRVLVAGTDRGLCAVLLGDDDAALVRELGSAFPRARVAPAAPGAVERLSVVLQSVDAVETPALPLDLRGTAFQVRVWRALTEIPPGATVSYGELAERLGEPTGARAVARACASNRLAVFVPCHRVIRADGSLAGYRWGLERKRRLLERERS
ncbi:MAG: bifunctional DNA-binding transcriptional regulator/O6-methylguanine-DNA methyltransferase Ada [Myxococcota bacterium]